MGFFKMGDLVILISSKTVTFFKSDGFKEAWFEVEPAQSYGFDCNSLLQKKSAEFEENIKLQISIKTQLCKDHQNLKSPTLYEGC